MEERARDSVGFSRMATLAALSIVVLLGIGAWEAYGALTKSGRSVSATNAPVEASARASTPFESVDWQAPASPAEAASDAAEAGSPVSTSDPDGIANIADNVVGALIGSYATLAENGVYIPEEGKKVAEDIGKSLRATVSYKSYSASDIKTDANISHERMLAYRNDLRIALEPLLKNPGYELGLFANYIDSRDTKYLELLQRAGENYDAAIANAAKVVVPQDALSYHVGILNALSEFAATIERMTEHADDAFASAALLRTYNGSEANLMTSFNTLATYYRSKLP